jgi:16S rRNA (adenine1518-N6/adenine1519-N6)-dimethyltransferase
VTPRDTETAAPLPPPRKSLGQVFLASGRVIHRIVAALGHGPDDVVVEIGPGRGALTRELVGTCRRLLLVEKDDVLAAMHRDRHADDPSVAVVHGDATALDLADVLAPGERARVVGNLPYNVGGQILFNLLRRRDRIDRMVLMFQREVAQRLAARPGDRNYGAASALVQLRAAVRPLFDVSPERFHPRPKVWSAVIEVVPLPPDPARDAVVDAPGFERLVHALHAQPRKTVANSLADGLRADKGRCEAWLRAAGIDPGARPATVPAAACLALFAATQTAPDVPRDS